MRQGVISQGQILINGMGDKLKHGIVPKHLSRPGRGFAGVQQRPAPGGGCVFPCDGTKQHKAAGLGMNCLEGCGALAGLQSTPLLQGLRGSTEQRWHVGQIVSCILSC